MNLPLIDGTHWTPPDSWLAEVTQLYEGRGVDVPKELAKMSAWLLGNPHRRKTRTGVKRYITGWLNKALDSAPKPVKVKAVNCCMCAAPATEGGHCAVHAALQRRIGRGEK